MIGRPGHVLKSLMLFFAFLLFGIQGCSKTEPTKTINKKRLDKKSSTSSPQLDTADIVYRGGKIYTVNEKQPWAEAVAIKNGKILKVGSAEDVKPLIGENTQVIELDGAFAMPGVHDTHIHPAAAGENLDKIANRLLFSESLSREEIQQALREYVKTNPGDGWIRGQKWGASKFPNGKADKSVIDEVISDRPVILLDETQHNAVINSKALEIAGITKDTQSPVNGHIEKDPNTSEPTGYLSEMGIFLAMKHVPQPGIEQYREAMLRSLDYLRAYGVTAYVDLTGNQQSLQTYKKLDDEGKLNMHIDFGIMINDYMADLVDPKPVIESRGKFRSRLINPDRVKYWADGTPSSETALLLEPYTNNPQSHGTMTVTPEQLESGVDYAGQNMQLTYHAVADGTTRKVLDLIEKARKAHPENKKRFHIGHCMLVHPDDIARFKELNVVAEMSPALWFPNGLLSAMTAYIGEDRVARFQPIKEFVDAGVIVSYGSDWPAGTPNANPWRGLEGMLTRMNPDGDRIGEKLGNPIDLETGLKILTLNGAMAMNNEKNRGSIEPGKYADIIILDQNPFDLVESSRHDLIDKIRPTTTVFEGKVVFDATARPTNSKND